MGNWQLDPYHTQVEFSAKHLGMMTVRGTSTNSARGRISIRTIRRRRRSR